LQIHVLTFLQNTIPIFSTLTKFTGSICYSVKSIQNGMGINFFNPVARLSKGNATTAVFL